MRTFLSKWHEWGLVSKIPPPFFFMSLKGTLISFFSSSSSIAPPCINCLWMPLSQCNNVISLFFPCPMRGFVPPIWAMGEKKRETCHMAPLSLTRTSSFFLIRSSCVWNVLPTVVANLSLLSRCGHSSETIFKSLFVRGTFFRSTGIIQPPSILATITFCNRRRGSPFFEPLLIYVSTAVLLKQEKE